MSKKKFSFNLTPIQTQGVSYIMNALRSFKGFLLADRMGLGKTAQAIAVLKEALKTKKPVLIIVPPYLIYNWLDELEKWGVKNSICVIDSGKQKIYCSDIYLCGYNLSVKQNILKQLYKLDFSLIICDEAHYLKGWDTLRSRYILGTFKNKKSNFLYKTKKILLLTGTPILNNVEELYNLVIRIAPEVLNGVSRDAFIWQFAEFIQVTPWGLKHKGIKNADILRKMIEPIFLSRQILPEVPEKINIDIKLKQDSKEIKDLLKEEQEFLKKHNIFNFEDILKLNNLEVATIAQTRQNVGKAKIPIAINLLFDLLEKTDKPITIYCYYRDTQKVLLDEINKKEKKKKVAVINGDVNMKKRDEICKNFQINNLDILCATIGALKEGVNLTAGNIVIFLEYDWTPANIDQAIARFQRKGQIDNVYVYRLFFDSGIDKYIINLLNKKSNMIKQIIN